MVIIVRRSFRVPPADRFSSPHGFRFLFLADPNRLKGKIKTRPLYYSAVPNTVRIRRRRLSPRRTAGPNFLQTGLRQRRRRRRFVESSARVLWPTRPSCSVQIIFAPALNYETERKRRNPGIYFTASRWIWSVFCRCCFFFFLTSTR